jgi:hypothetical protein
MERLMAALVIVCAAGGCSRPCVDGERTSNSGAWGFGTVRSGYDPCPQNCCKPGWSDPRLRLPSPRPLRGTLPPLNPASCATLGTGPDVILAEIRAPS